MWVRLTPFPKPSAFANGYLSPADDLKRDLGDILLLFVTADELKHLLRQILLLFVTTDDLKQDLGRIMLKIVITLSLADILHNFV